MMFRKVLIANRGEIAVRVGRACRELGIPFAVVYSDADRRALHVLEAEEAHRIGPAPARESYLNVAAIVEAARSAGADALHPGYGFLSEDPALAEACHDAGVTFIGPPPDAMRLMGDKAAAKTAVEQAGVPTVPGYHGQDDSPERLLAEAQAIGVPVLIKAGGGGGGRGMRVVRHVRDLPDAVESARREALAAFGNGRLLLEKLVEHPRHVEVQIMADRHGSVLHFGERDCSVQRRHQKVVEESPAPAVTSELRARLGEAAVRAARTAGYENAGTVEFLLAQDGTFYFLEMNARLQVEHPVTEMVTGLDLVKLQIAVAAGQPLPLQQEQVELRGHAIECRIYAEDPFLDHLPSAGTVVLFEPPHWPGIRNDVGTYSGDEVSLHYDPMLAKLIVHAEDRPAAVARLHLALLEYRVEGVRNNLPLLRYLADHPEFRAGRTHTGFLDLYWPPSDPDRELPLPAEVLLAVAAFELQSDYPEMVGVASTDSRSSGHTQSPWSRAPWQPGRVGVPLRYVVDGIEERVAITAPLATGEPWSLLRAGQVTEALVETVGHGRLLLRQGTRVGVASVEASAHGWLVEWRGRAWRLERPAGPSLAGAAHSTAGGHAARALSAPMPGKIVRVAVQEGQHVDARQLLLVLEAMKIEHLIYAPFEGTVRSVPHGEGVVVDAGTLLVEMEAA